ncbi:hypothetical protein EVAR_92382_1 [Eumeta japonica]|uniref:Uncharacterized protein n=1 Tax=Eumeta variegata TaxID=151549 RepID=A0A4C1TIQ1_EUMVA|nr:hypothetical protein EVAR_92382_1 [Eumeta japonica]
MFSKICLKQKGRYVQQDISPLGLDVRTPSPKSVPFFVEEFHRARKPALHRFLVHGQSSDDKQRPYAKSQVCAVLPRRVPPRAETSAAAPFSRPRSVER